MVRVGVSPAVASMTKGQLMSPCVRVRERERRESERGVFETVTCDWPVFTTEPETVQTLTTAQ